MADYILDGNIEYEIQTFDGEKCVTIYHINEEGPLFLTRKDLENLINELDK